MQVGKQLASLLGKSGRVFSHGAIVRRSGRVRTRAQGSHDGCHEEETVGHLVAPLGCGSQTFPLRAKVRAYTPSPRVHT